MVFVRDRKINKNKNKKWYRVLLSKMRCMGRVCWIEQRKGARQDSETNTTSFRIQPARLPSLFLVYPAGGQESRSSKDETCSIVIKAATAPSWRRAPLHLKAFLVVSRLSMIIFIVTIRIHHSQISITHKGENIVEKAVSRCSHVANSTTISAKESQTTGGISIRELGQRGQGGLDHAGVLGKRSLHVRVARILLELVQVLFFLLPGHLALSPGVYISCNRQGDNQRNCRDHTIFIWANMFAIKGQNKLETCSPGCLNSIRHKKWQYPNCQWAQDEKVAHTLQRQLLKRDPNGLILIRCCFLPRAMAQRWVGLIGRKWWWSQLLLQEAKGRSAGYSTHTGPCSPAKPWRCSLPMRTFGMTNSPWSNRVQVFGFDQCQHPLVATKINSIGSRIIKFVVPESKSFGCIDKLLQRHCAACTKKKMVIQK